LYSAYTLTNLKCAHDATCHMGSHSVCYLPPDRRDSHTLSNNKSLQRGHTNPANYDRQSSAINQPLPHRRWMRVSKWNFIW